MIPLTVKPLCMFTAPVKSEEPEKEVVPVNEVGLLKMASMLNVTLSVPLSVVAPRTLLPTWEGVEETSTLLFVFPVGGLMWLNEVKEDEAKKDNIKLTMPINRICICCIHTNIYTRGKSRVIGSWRLEIGGWRWEIGEWLTCHPDENRDPDDFIWKGNTTGLRLELALRVSNVSEWQTEHGVTMHVILNDSNICEGSSERVWTKKHARFTRWILRV